MRLRRSATGALVFDLLTNYERLTHRELEQMAQLTRAQVARGLRYIREIFADQECEPLVMEQDGRECYYRLADESQQSEDYMRRRTALLLRWAHNLERGTSAPAAAKFHTRRIRRIHRDIVRVREDLEDVLGDM